MIIELKKVIEQSQSSEAPRLSTSDPSFNRAVKVMREAVEGRHISLVQGPPGTGKTAAIFESISYVLDLLGDDEIILYVAPTHELGVEFLRRFSSAAIGRGGWGYNLKDLLRMVRIYGSRYDYTHVDALVKAPDKDTRIIITTEYQRPFIKDKAYIHIVVDEASRSLVHRALTPAVRVFIDHVYRKRSISGSLSIIGDPMQAISVDVSERFFLLMNTAVHALRKYADPSYNANKPPADPERVKELLNWAETNLREFARLRYTYRLPDPIHSPINHGFYDGALNPIATISYRLRSMEIRDIRTGISSIDEAIEEVYGILSTDIGFIVVSHKRYAYEDGEYDATRAKLGLEFGVAMANVTGRRVSVVVPYREMLSQMRLSYLHRFKSLVKRGDVEITTIHRILGGEADAVVAILGKEYTGKDDKTIYFNEPETLNVQLSRSRGPMVVIGNIERLGEKAKEMDQQERTTKYKPIWLTCERIEKLVESKVAVEIKPKG
jgi:hypothetical protein